MKITKKGDKVHLELYTNPMNEEWKPLFDFKVKKEDFEELRKHIIKTLEDFKLDG